MKRPFLPEITYMRGLCMLGVIGIHVGSYALQNPLANVQLISVLEILSRFAVPAPLPGRLPGRPQDPAVPAPLPGQEPL
mgnify:CR=1 FL=1